MKPREICAFSKAGKLSVLRKEGAMMCRFRLFAISVSVAACAALADGKVFWWKGADWGMFDDPANWSVGAEDAGNPDGLVPGAEDAFAHSANAKVDWSRSTIRPSST